MHDPLPSILSAVSIDEQFCQQTAADVAASLQGLVRLYLTPYAKFWGLPAGRPQPGQPPQPGANKFAPLTPGRRVAALGNAAVSTFMLNGQLQAAIEQIVNGLLKQIGVPPSGSTLAFLLPFVSNGVFKLPGVPVGYVFTPAADGSATLAEAAA